jgi:hypothetical protein
LHPKVKEKYDSHPEFDYFKTANDINEEGFFSLADVSKKPVKHFITKVVRTKLNGQEHVYYHETLRSYDFLNNAIDHSRIVGKYDDPQFTSNIDPRTNKPRATQVSGFETMYEFPWTPNIVEQWAAQDNYQLDEHCSYVLKADRTYGGFTFEQFCTETYDDLVTLGKFGTKNPAQIKHIQTRQRKAKGVQEPIAS